MEGTVHVVTVPAGVGRVCAHNALVILHIISSCGGTGGGEGGGGGRSTMASCPGPMTVFIQP